MKKFNWIKILLIFILIYTLFAFIPGFFNLQDTLFKIPFSWFISASLFTISSHLILSLRWLYFIRYLNFSLNYLQSLKIYLAGLSFMAAPARTGEAIRSIWLSTRHKIGVSNGLAITITERISDLLSALFIIFWSTGNINKIILFLCILLLLNYIFKQEYILFKFKSLLRYLSTTIINSNSLIKSYLSKKDLVNKVTLTTLVLKSLSKPLPIIFSTFLCSLSWLTEAILLYITFYNLNVSLTFQQAALIRTTMGIGGAISLLPGGLLTSETTSIGLAIIYGSGQVEAFAATLFIRFYTLFFPTIIGLIAIFIQKDLNSSLKSHKPI